MLVEDLSAPRKQQHQGVNSVAAPRPSRSAFRMRDRFTLLTCNSYEHTEDQEDLDVCHSATQLVRRHQAGRFPRAGTVRPDPPESARLRRHHGCRLASRSPPGARYLWESEEHSAAALSVVGPEVGRLLEPLMSHPSELIGAGTVNLHRSSTKLLICRIGWPVSRPDGRWLLRKAGDADRALLPRVLATAPLHGAWILFGRYLGVFRRAAGCTILCGSNTTTEDFAR